MDRALLLLALTAVVDAVVVVRAPVPRVEKLALILLQLLLACVALAATFTLNVLRHVDGAGGSLLTCGAGAVLFVVAGAPDGDRTGWSARLVRASTSVFAFLLLCGLVGEMLLVAGVVGAWGAAVPAGFVFLVAAVLVSLGRERARRSTSALATARARTDVVAAVVLGAAAVVAGCGGVFAASTTLWAGLLAVSSTLCTMARVAVAPPDRRDGVVVACAAVLIAAVVVDVESGVAAAAAAWARAVCAVAVAVIAGRALLIPPRTRKLSPQPLSSTLTPAGLGGVVPLLDDALLRRPGRPRVLARTPARRLLDAALDRAQRAQPPSRGRPHIDVQVPEGDADVDGDPSELAEALCAILDNALRQQTRHPWARVSVVVRAATQTVSFEVSDTAPVAAGDSSADGADGPFVGKSDDVDRPGYGVSLARARLLVERHGGQLHARHAKDGSNVQITLPRRLVRGAAGAA